MPTPERNTPRVLACVLCQQRKVKCNRKFPCANCIRSHSQCVPAVTLAPHQRRRRFPERELLDRLRHYESLLSQSNIKFEPLHKDPLILEYESCNADGAGGNTPQDDEQPQAAAGADRSSRETPVKPEILSRNSDDDGSDSSPDDLRETMIKKTWNQSHQSNDHLLFCSRKTAVDFSTLHPEQIEIFRLWQIYLDNVNPLLKVTHTPTLQGRIIDAASNVASVKPALAALMFSIYCVSIMSLVEDDCHATFGSPKEELLTRYQFGCQQALLNCSFLRTDDRDCLTALYLYLISVRPSTDPHSLSSMLSLAIRIAQRMGLHSESAYAKCPALEAEMRRRLWWSLVLFDTRISEMADYKAVVLTPPWDCKVPLNVNDFDLQPEMKDPPAVEGKSTEALFAVVRSEMGEFVRHSAFHLDFISPALKAVAKDVQRGPIPIDGELVLLEKMLEDKYLKFCNPENPLHFMTIWTARGYLAKTRLIEYFSRLSRSSTQQTDAQRDDAISHALRMLECDTKLMTSPLTKGYLWLVHFYFPFPAYIHICSDLKRRPIGDRAELAWEIMSENYEARITSVGQGDIPWFKIFAKIILQAWEAREVAASQTRKPLVPARIVSEVKQKVAQITQDEQNTSIEQPNVVLGMNVDNYSTSMPIDFVGHNILYGIGGQGYDGLETGAYPEMHVQTALEIDLNQSDWNAMDWNLMHGRGW